MKEARQHSRRKVGAMFVKGVPGGRAAKDKLGIGQFKIDYTRGAFANHRPDTGHKVIDIGDQLQYRATADQIAKLRRMIAEPTTTVYSDSALADDIVQRYTHAGCHLVLPHR